LSSVITNWIISLILILSFLISKMVCVGSVISVLLIF
jgi:hypothetical protein